jgi:mannose-6-phosphate isomerase-like protein (cupin superfamily)
MILRPIPATVSILALGLFAGSITLAASADEIAVRNLDDILKDEPLLPGGSTASIVASIRAGGAELAVLVLSKNRLHHHEAQDHVLYVARGSGTARLENATGQIETRAIKAGDILSLPRGRKHGFEKFGGEDLVFLVVATPLPPGVEETTYHE